MLFRSVVKTDGESASRHLVALARPPRRLRLGAGRWGHVSALLPDSPPPPGLLTPSITRTNSDDKNTRERDGGYFIIVVKLHGDPPTSSRYGTVIQ
ncbi:hypothetical protein C0Q70_20712 [Pomacea canaliculata]|uniref:Uncharacterized protein n=1 Tax=Pomacea canaliculata TaxID=400727 RepID=A0A2T7NGD2_POMCA|nr:hypothetical protein C0Q70_20712 [Pomacea canaliculata]